MRTMIAIMAATAVSVLAACAPMEGADEAATPQAIDAPDQCQAARHQNWIGRNRSELPQPLAGQTWRVTCTTCPVTMDFNPNRLNVLYEEATGVIREVKCG